MNNFFLNTKKKNKKILILLTFCLLLRKNLIANLKIYTCIKYNKFEFYTPINNKKFVDFNRI